MGKAKKILAAVLALCICMSGVSALAAGGGVTYTSPSGEYTAQKISHPEAGLGEVDGIIEYDSGENDRGQSYSWSAVGYGDYMYVGTCYAAIWSTIKILAMQSGMGLDVYKAMLDALYNGSMYTGDAENNPSDAVRGVLLRVNMKTGDVKIVRGPENTSHYRAAIEFNGKLYFASSGGGLGAYMVEVDPANNDASKIVYVCEKLTNPLISVSIRGLTTVNGKLVASMIGNDGAYIVASENPSAGQESFEVICTQEDLLDYPAYLYSDSIFGGAIWDMVTFNDKIYVTVVTGKSGNKQAFAMFCGEEDASGKWNFRLLIGDPEDGARYPYGLGADRSGAANLVVHDGYLYIGGYNDPMIALPAVLQMNFEELYKDLDAPVCLWRMDAEENIEMVAGEPNELFPEVKGNLGAGLGSNLNQYVWRMVSYEGRLYVGTFDIGSLAYPVMQLTNGDILRRTPEEWKTQLQYIKELLELIGRQNDQSAARSAGAESKLSTMAGAMSGMTELLDQGGIDDLASTEKFYELLRKVVSAYESIRDYLPDSVKETLDGILNQETVDNFYYFIGVCKYLSQGERGFDLLVSEDGLNFDAITRNGFGDPYNHGCRVFAITDAGLCIGTANPFYGTQLWRLDGPNGSNTGEPSAPTTDTSTEPQETQPEGTTAAGSDSDGDVTDVGGTQPSDAAGEGNDAQTPDIPLTGEGMAIAMAVSAVMAGGVLLVLSRKGKK